MRKLLLYIILVAPSMLLAQPRLQDLHPRPKISYERLSFSGLFEFAPGATKIVTPVSPDVPTSHAVSFLNRELKKRLGDTMEVIPITKFNGQGRAFIVGPIASLTSFGDPHLSAGEQMPDSGGYVLDVTPMTMMLIGRDANGVFSGISTVVQLLGQPLGGSCAVRAAHINDFPDYQNRWVFSQHNLRGVGALDQLRKIEDTMALHKLNGLQQNDWKFNTIETQPSWYFLDADTLKRYSADRDIDIIPGVAPIGYSDGILFHDPNLAEGFRTDAKYFVEGDTGRLIPDANVSIPNSGFETVNGDNFTGFSIDGPGKSSFAHHSVFHAGSTSVRMENFKAGNAAGNCRAIRQLKCQPYRHYVLSAWMKGESLNAGEVKLLAIGSTPGGKSHTLLITQYAVGDFGSTWRKVETAFSTLDCTNLNIYAGVWDGRSGKLWIDDFEIRDGGLTNVIRRPGAPLHVRNVKTGREYSESVDFQPVSDPAIDVQPGVYLYKHSAPTFRIKTSGAIRNGDTLLISSFHPLTNVAGTDGLGSVMVCPAEDTLYSIIKDQVQRVTGLLEPKQYFMGHDEVRAFNQDSSCAWLNHNEDSAGFLMTNSARRIENIIRGITPGAPVYVWGDMFDTSSNAVDDYYLVRGSLKNDALDLPKDITIVNWAGWAMSKSLKYFSDLGFSQMTSPYYDVGNTSTIRNWRKAMEGVKNVTGSMYTTWSADYRFLTAFGDYMWSAGPFLMHQPIDSLQASVVAKGDSIRIEAEILPDSYDPTDKIDTAYVMLVNKTALTPSFMPMVKEAGNTYVAYAHEIPDVLYRITARNSQGITRTTPDYVISGPAPVQSVYDRSKPNLTFGMFPNPARDVVSISSPQSWSLSIIDVVGNKILKRDGRGKENIDVSALSTGAFRFVVTTSAGISTQVLSIVK